MKTLQKFLFRDQELLTFPLHGALKFEPGMCQLRLEKIKDGRIPGPLAGAWRYLGA